MSERGREGLDKQNLRGSHHVELSASEHRQLEDTLPPSAMSPHFNTDPSLLAVPRASKIGPLQAATKMKYISDHDQHTIQHPSDWPWELRTCSGPEAVAKLRRLRIDVSTPIVQLERHPE